MAETENWPARSNGDSRLAWTVAIVYALAGAAWILGSDNLANYLVNSGLLPISELRLQTYKGWFWIALTAAGLFVIVRDGVRRMRASESARVRSEERYRQLVEVSPDGILVHSEGKILYANRAMATILGMGDADQLVGRDVLAVVHPDYHDLARRRMRLIADEPRELPRIEERLVRADGSQVWVEVAAGPLDFGGRQGAQVVVRDISERVRAREARRRLESERADLLERLQLILERMPIACILNDPQFRFTYWNPAAEKVFGYSFDEVRGKHPFGIITPVTAQPLVEKIFHDLETTGNAIPAIAENMTKDGRTIRCSWVNAALRSRDGKFLGIISMANDISEQLRVEAALRRTAATLSKAQEIAHLGSWEWDVLTDEVILSDEIYRIYGLDPATRLTMPPPTPDWAKAFVHADDRPELERMVEEVLRNPDARFEMRFRLVRPNGDQRIVNAQAELERDAEGRVIRFIGTTLDITNLTKAENELRRLNETLELRVAERTTELEQANEDLRTFAYSITHDLRAPLRSMQGFAQALLEDYSGKLDEPGQDFVRRIVAAAARMDRLTVELLEYNQLARREIVPQRVSLALLLHDIVGQVERDTSLPRARINIREPMPWALAHRTTLATVLTNLLMNATKFTSPGVSPTIEVRAEDRGAGVVRVWVSDNGIGIPPQHQDRIFHVFERLHTAEEYPGTGLGLAIVRRAVERMGGHVGVESAVGRGSQFWIELARDPESP